MQDRSQETNPVSGAAAGGGSDSSDSATISANDFLTLLVTEMKNQDPTADTDPNEYINQLVQVNSLEQLISINQTLSTDSSATPTGGAVKHSTFNRNRPARHRHRLKTAILRSRRAIQRRSALRGR